jgi:hypothetical protein
MVKTNTAKKMMLHHASNILDQFAPNVPTAMFPGLPTLENIEGNNVSWFAQGFRVRLAYLRSLFSSSAIQRAALPFDCLDNGIITQRNCHLAREHSRPEKK